MSKKPNLMGEVIGEYDLRVPLSDDERTEKQEKFAKNHQHIYKQKLILDAAKAEYKDQTEMFVRENKDLLAEVSQGYVEKTVRAVEWPNVEEGVFEYYAENADGTPLVVVPMTPTQKRQLRIAYQKQD